MEQSGETIPRRKIVVSEITKKIKKVINKEEEIMQVAVARALAAHQKNPTHESVRNLDAAKKALAEFNHKKHEQENPEEARIIITDALLYLKEQGWKIEKSKLYEEKSIIGYKIINNNITFKKIDLDKYARKFLKPMSETDSSTIEDKLKWDARISEQKFKDMELEAKIKEGLYILKSEVEQLLAARAAFLKDNLGQGFIHSRASKLIEIVEGNSDHTPELIDYWLKQIEEVFDYYSKPMRFEVPAVMVNEEEEDEN